MKKRLFQRIVLVIIAVLGIKTGFENLKSSLAEKSNDTAVIADWDKRLSKLTEPIPYERGLVGYLSNEDIPGAAAMSSDAEGEFVLTQYVIIPLILVRGTDQEWNILNLDRESFEQWRQKNEGDFEVVKSGGGMYLVHKVTP